MTKRHRDVTLRHAAGSRLRRKRCPRDALDVLGGASAICMYTCARFKGTRSTAAPEEETAQGAIMCRFRHAIAVTVYIVSFRAAPVAIRRPLESHHSERRGRGCGKNGGGGCTCARGQGRYRYLGNHSAELSTKYFYYRWSAVSSLWPYSQHSLRVFLAF